MRSIPYAIGFSFLAISASCVHEWPETAAVHHRIVLNVHHQLEWTEPHELTVTRGEKGLYRARYHFQIYRSGDRSQALRDTVIFSDDISRSDFSSEMSLPPGDYDLWTWTDWGHVSEDRSLYFDTKDFSSIWYPEPYSGNNELRDALRGMTSFTIDETHHDGYSKEVELLLERPLARYEFISTDLDEFVDSETTRSGRKFSTSVQAPLSRLPELPNYRVKMIYAGYMPHKFDNFQNKPVDSRTGQSYNATITPMSDTEARLGFDYVMVNGHESSIPVKMEIYDPDGNLIGRTGTVEIPTKRNRMTYVRGAFLTSQATGGVGIDPSFEGEYNIEIK